MQLAEMCTFNGMLSVHISAFCSTFAKNLQDKEESDNRQSRVAAWYDLSWVWSVYRISLALLPLTKKMAQINTILKHFRKIFAFSIQTFYLCVLSIY